MLEIQGLQDSTQYGHGCACAGRARRFLCLYHESGGKIGNDYTEKARALVAVQREGLESENGQAYSPAIASTMFLRDLAKPNLDLLSERLKEHQEALNAYRADLAQEFGK